MIEWHHPGTNVIGGCDIKSIIVADLALEKERIAQEKKLKEWQYHSTQVRWVNSIKP